MSPYETALFKESLQRAIVAAIGRIGLDAFKRTSFFGSNESPARSEIEKRAASAAIAKAKSRDSRCPHCLGICNPLPDGSGYCDKCQGAGHAKSKGGSQS